jgi:histidine triad (HIT) family protein
MKNDQGNCIFCKILKGHLEASVVYEDENAIAIMDIQPVNPGHVLVIPKQHIPYFNEVTHDIGAHIFKVGIKIGAAMKQADIKCEGINYLMADGETAGQEVFHAHLHVFPRFKNDGFGFRFNEQYYTLPERTELDQIAARIKASIS